jgi:hypothetical protein
MIDFEDLPHARPNDPATSHEAVPVNLSQQAFQVLRAYSMTDPRAILDHDAYRLVGLDNGGRLTHQRCSDLRAKGMIERTKDRGRTPSGKAGYLSRITQKGRDYLRGVIPK